MDREEAQLRRLQKFKAVQHRNGSPLGDEMLSFFKQAVQKRQTKLANIAETWAQLVPEIFNDHCALESFSRGSLTVAVDSSAHLYELKQLLLAGLEKQLLLACRATGLKKITLKQARWYTDEKNPKF